MTDAADSNGRATIREVHALLTEQRMETRGHLDNMEERIVRALHGTEDRIVSSIAGLDKRVSSLEEWRVESEQTQALTVARRDGRWSVIRAPVDWAASHWQVVITVAAVVVVVLAFLADVRIDAQP